MQANGGITCRWAPVFSNQYSASLVVLLNLTQSPSQFVGGQLPVLSPSISLRYTQDRWSAG